MWSHTFLGTGNSGRNIESFADTTYHFMVEDPIWYGCSRHDLPFYGRGPHMVRVFLNRADRDSYWPRGDGHDAVFHPGSSNWNSHGFCKIQMIEHNLIWQNDKCVHFVQILLQFNTSFRPICLDHFSLKIVFIGFVQISSIYSIIQLFLL